MVKKTDKRHVKPSPPLFHVEFPARGGRVRKVTVPLPGDKGQLEAVICQKFVVALERLGRKLSSSSIRTPHDFVFLENGAPVHIELTEVVQEKHLEIVSDRKKYTDELSEAVKELDLQGLHIHLNFADDYVNRWPAVQTAAGMAIIRRWCDGISSRRERLSHLPGGRSLILNDKRFSIRVTRIAPARNGSLPTCSFDPGIPYPVDESRRLLASTLRKKVRKSYAPMKGAKLIVVAYQVDGVIPAPSYEPEPYAEARTILENEHHAFDEAWYFHPDSTEQGGNTVVIWQSEGSPATDPDPYFIRVSRLTLKPDGTARQVD